MARTEAAHRTIPLVIRKAAVLYNPLSGRQHRRRQRDVDALLSVLRGAGVEVTASPTRGCGATAEQVKGAIAEGFETIFACGGDGTIHDIAQALVGTSTALGIIPLGTANALAHDIGMPLSPVAAAKSNLTAEPCRISVGRIEYRTFDGNRASHYFLVTAGVGVDAHLFYALDPLVKRRFGMASYYAKAVHLWLTCKMLPFSVMTRSPAEADWACTNASQLLAVRIRNFGGVVRELAPGASLDRTDLRLVVFRTRSRMKFLRYVLRGLLGATWKIPGIELRSTGNVTCHYLSDPVPADERIFVEADGELLGTLPAQISIVPDALTLLVPTSNTPKQM